jgi:hypothetical protein
LFPGFFEIILIVKKNVSSDYYKALWIILMPKKYLSGYMYLRQKAVGSAGG